MQVIKINHKKSRKGIMLESGALLLCRQGSSSQIIGTICGSRGCIHISCNLNKSSDVGKVQFTPVYPDGNRGETIFRSGIYRKDEMDDLKKMIPENLENDVLNFVELHTNERPTSIVNAVHGDFYGSGVDNDIFLSPLRFDAELNVIVGVDSSLPIAHDGSGIYFDPSQVDIAESCSEIQRTALEKALRIGFHPSDIKLGADYCMRRLAWLAGCYVIEESDESLEVFVLASDMESEAKTRI